MRITMGVLGVLGVAGLGVSFALAQSPPTVKRGATLLAAVEPAPEDQPPVARAVADAPSPGNNLPTRPAAGWGTINDPNVTPAGATVPAAAPGAVMVPSVPSNDDGSPLVRGFDKIKGAFGATNSNATDAPNANSPYRGTTPNGATMYAGPPAYRWYGWGSVTPGANPNAPTGLYPKASANWYAITGATPGAFPTPVTNTDHTPGVEPPSYAGLTTRTPTAISTPTYSGSGLPASTIPPPDLQRPANPDVRSYPPAPAYSTLSAATIPPPASLIPPPSSINTAYPPPTTPVAPVAPHTPVVPTVPTMPVVPDPTSNTMGSLQRGPIAPLPPPGLLTPSATPALPSATTPPTTLPTAIVKPSEQQGRSAMPVMQLPPPTMQDVAEPKPLAVTPLPGSAPAPSPSAGPGPAALPVSVTDYQLKWQTTTDTSGQWNTSGKPLPVMLPAAQPAAQPTPPAAQPTPPAAQPTPPAALPVLPEPNWQQPGATDTTNSHPVARGQIGQTGPDPIIALIQKICEGRGTGVDVRYTGSKRLSVCFECKTATEGQSLVRDISARPEFTPYRIDFCVLVK